MSDPIFDYVKANPFGLNVSLTWSTPVFIDIDGDNDQDTFVGNGSGSILFFRNTGTSRNPVFSASITNAFGLNNAAGYFSTPTFVDIDGDGDFDSFVGSGNGNTAFFRNTGTINNPVFASASINPFGLSDVGTYASPTFVDIDGDGDFDLFQGGNDGYTLFFRNNGTANNPIFAPPETFYGAGWYLHPTFIDIDGDGDLDAFVGSGGHYGYGSLTFFRNIGTSTNPLFYANSIDPFGLSGPGNYVSPTFVDIDNDGDSDAFLGNLNASIKFYQNTGPGDYPYFSWNQSYSHSVGLRPNSTLIDFDGDRDLDVFVGKGYSYYDSGYSAGDTLYIENIGTPSNPVLADAIVNPFGLTKVGSFSSPAFADIDNDSDLDAFIGNDGGNTIFFENIGTHSIPKFSTAITNPFGIIDVGLNAKPVLIDIDGDLDQDIFVNEMFFKNIGTRSNPAFDVPRINPFGLSGNNFTFVDEDNDGDFDAFGAGFFRNVGTVNNPSFISEKFPLDLPDPGAHSYYTSNAIADMDGDLDLDLYVTGFSDYYRVWDGFLINNNAPNVINLTVPEVYTKNKSLNLNDIVVTDHDSNNITVSIALSDIAAGRLSTATSGAVTSKYTASTGVWVASGPITNINTLLAGLSFIPAQNFNHALTITTSISDGVAAPLSGTKNFSVLLVSTPGNDILTGTSFDNDTVTYASAASAVSVSLNIVTAQNTIGAGFDTLTNVESLMGSAFNDNLTGNTFNNLLDGKAGNDILRGWSGADTMIGGPGGDTYFVENTKDIVLEKINEGIDTVSSNLTYTLPANVENLILTGLVAINGTGNSLANIITGNNAANQLNGDSGNDALDGGLGNNRLTGGTGMDLFRFTSKGHVDVITDFNVTNDTIQLENAVFTKLTATGNLAANQFRIGSKALDANDYVIYNNVTGALLYDADGSGTLAATQFATLGAGLAMTSADIVVI